MRIVVLSEDLAEPWDEGIKKFTYSVAKALDEHHDVLMLNVDRSNVGGEEAVRIPGTRTFLSGALKNAIRSHAPAFVLYVPSPSNTISSFARAAVLRRIAPKAAHAMVALIPRRHSPYLRGFLKRTAPDVIFVPSYRTLLYLSRAGLRGDVLSVGVDPNVFKPASRGERDELRRRYDISPGAFVVLHVGHISEKRNLETLAALCDGAAVEVVVIGSTSTTADDALAARLRQNGVRVIRELVKVDEFYRLADCYVFPVRDSEGCVEMPLSVLEALASGLPVFATPFGGLRDFLIDGEDVTYFDTDESLGEGIARLRSGTPPAIRDMSEFSWQRIASHILETVGGKAG